MAEQYATSQNALLVTVGVVTVVAVVGTVLAPDHAVQVIGFCTLIVVSLLNLLGQVKTAVRVEETKATLADVTQANQQKLDAVAEKVEEVHKATNGLKDDLVAATDRAARAEGKAEGKAEAEARNPRQGD